MYIKWNKINELRLIAAPTLCSRHKLLVMVTTAAAAAVVWWWEYGGATPSDDTICLDVATTDGDGKMRGRFMCIHTD